MQFTDTSAGGPTSWAWDFGDGGDLDLANPAHTYAAAGTYTVKVTVVELQGLRHLDETDLVTVTAHAPIAGSPRRPSSGTGPLNVTSPTPAPTGPPSGRGTSVTARTSTAQNPSHTYSAAGNYAVSLTVTNSGGANTTCAPT